MTRDEFERILNRRLELTRKTLVDKSREYATPGDRLHNFNIAGMLLGVTPFEAALGFSAKHWVSIRDELTRVFVDLRKTGKADGSSREWIDEKLGDAFTYLFLLEALLIEGGKIRPPNFNPSDGLSFP